jgi:putative transposase
VQLRAVANREVAFGITRAVASGMTVPRQVLPEQFYMLTRRCTQRQFLLRPDAETNNAYAYCLAEAAERYEMELIISQQMSNHHHTKFFDRYGRAIEFTAHFHKNLAKCQNALRGRWENMWSSEPPCIVQLVDRADVIDKIVYVAANPVLDHLVDRVHHWPGVKTVRALLEQEAIQAHRPAHFFREDGPMPETVTLRFSIPPELGETEKVIHEVRERIAAVEVEQMRIRAKTGKRIVGRRGVLRQSWRDSPTSREPRRNLRPRVAARSKWSRIEALRRNHAFLIAYRNARAAWLAGTPIPFPAGTYWLVRFVGVPVENLKN